MFETADDQLCTVGSTRVSTMPTIGAHVNTVELVGFVVSSDCRLQ